MSKFATGRGNGRNSDEIDNSPPFSRAMVGGIDSGIRMKNGKSFCCRARLRRSVVGTAGSTHGVQCTVLVVGGLPEIDGALPDEVEESVGHTAARECFDLPEFDADPLRLHTLLSYPDLNSLGTVGDEYTGLVSFDN